MNKASAILPDQDGPWGDSKTTNHQTIDDTTAQRHAEVDAAAQRQKDYQVQLSQLTKCVEDAKQRLANALAFKVHLSRRIVELRDLVLTLWGRSKDVVNVDPASQALDCYQTILIAELAIKDWSRVEPVLRANVDVASRKLAEFSKLQQPK